MRKPNMPTLAVPHKKTQHCYAFAVPSWGKPPCQKLSFPEGDI